MRAAGTLLTMNDVDADNGSTEGDRAGEHEYDLGNSTNSLSASYYSDPNSIIRQGEHHRCIMNDL